MPIVVLAGISALLYFVALRKSARSEQRCVPKPIPEDEHGFEIIRRTLEDSGMMRPERIRARQESEEELFNDESRVLRMLIARGWDPTSDQIRGMLRFVLAGRW